MLRPNATSSYSLSTAQVCFDGMEPCNKICRTGVCHACRGVQQGFAAAKPADSQELGCGDLQSRLDQIKVIIMYIGSSIPLLKYRPVPSKYKTPSTIPANLLFLQCLQGIILYQWSASRMVCLLVSYHH